jgi:hypothetical protein
MDGSDLCVMAAAVRKDMVFELLKSKLVKLLE